MAPLQVGNDALERDVVRLGAPLAGEVLNRESFAVVPVEEQREMLGRQGGDRLLERDPVAFADGMQQ